MTAKKAAPRPTRRTAQPAKKTPAKPAKKQVRKGAQPARKPAKKVAAGTKRRPTGTKRSLADQIRADLPRKGDSVGITLLIRQAARIADRLESIAAILDGDAAVWAKLTLPRSDAKRGRIWVEVKVDAVLIEERNQATLLRHVLREIDRQREGEGGDDPDEDDDLDID